MALSRSVGGLGGRCVLMCVGMFLQLPRLLIDEVEV